MVTHHVDKQAPLVDPSASEHPYRFGKQTLYLDDCRAWLREAEPNSIHAVVTDPPYGLHEYQPREVAKLRAGRGGVWRLPPSFDGAQRRPLPRFTVNSAADRAELRAFFMEWAELLLPALRPGAHVFIASLYTDEAPACKGARMRHSAVKHSVGEYVDS